jgi:hypothetical protein
MSTLTSGRPAAKYGCAQQDLYTVTETIVISLVAQLLAFAGYNGIYIMAFCTALKQEILAARALPDSPARSAIRKILRKRMEAKAIEALAAWGQLVTAIEHGFAEDEVPERLDEAGQGHYNGAAKRDWDEVKALLQSANTFMQDYAAELTTGGLPTGATGAMGQLQTDFEQLQNDYLQALEGEKEHTDIKVEANNALYARIMKVCKDGKKVFRQNAALREQFIFATVLGLVRRHVVRHDVSGLVRLVAGGNPVVQADVRFDRILLDGTMEVFGVVKTDVDGMYKMIGAADGRYLMTVSKNGLQTVTREVEVDGGPLTEDFEMAGV